MDLIYANAERQDQGVLLCYELDLAFGKSENDFECRIPADAHCCGAGFLLYIEGAGYGGLIDSIESDTSSGEVVYSGRTWQGVLNSKVIEPNEGESHLVVSGEANAVIASLLERLGLSGLFEASADDSGLTISSYQMNRYAAGYDGICKMLSTVGGKLLASYRDGKVLLSAVERHDYSQEEEFDSDQINFVVKRDFSSVNHLICMGQGELSERMIIHLYADTEGNISRTQTQFGLAEFTSVYDYSNAESEEELENGGRERLAELRKPATLTVDFDADDDKYDVGDVVGARDHITGLFVTAEISTKLVTVKDGQTTISYKVGD